ncbi:hypothetical protein [Herbaspirillum huttiense]|uniref:hypothetical protein n=1 Tax=Herbaspirillum huttiense TaxID=863372 RepID=UPI003F2DCF53
MKTMFRGVGLITVEDIPASPLPDSMIDLNALAESSGIKRCPSDLPSFEELLLQELERHAHMPARFPPRRCLSCGAQTNAEGQLPCGH